MRGKRVRWANVGRLAGGLALGGALLVFVPEVLSAPEPPPLPSDVGIDPGLSAAGARPGRHRPAATERRDPGAGRGQGSAAADHGGPARPEPPGPPPAGGDRSSTPTGEWPHRDRISPPPEPAAPAAPPTTVAAPPPAPPVPTPSPPPRPARGPLPLYDFGP